MKKYVFNLSVVAFVFAFLVAGINTATAQQSPKPTKKQAALFINKTNKIMHQTGKKVKEKKVYTGYLKKGTKVQKAAIKQFKQGHYQQAINKSFVARHLAFKAFEANGGTIPQDWRLKNKKIVTRRPTPEDLSVTEEEKSKDQEAAEEVEELEEVEE